jgi:hypothetical protein
MQEVYNRGRVLAKEAHAVNSLFQEDLWCAKQLNDRGLEFIQADHYAVDCIRPKCDELERICTDYWILYGAREKLLLDSLELHKKIDQVGHLKNFTRIRQVRLTECCKISHKTVIQSKKWHRICVNLVNKVSAIHYLYVCLLCQSMLLIYIHQQ